MLHQQIWIYFPKQQTCTIVVYNHQGMTKKKFSACPWGKLWLKSTCPEFILTWPDFFLLCAVSPLLWMTKSNHLLISLKYRSVKSLKMCTFCLCLNLLAKWATCEGDLLVSHKNSLAPGKRTGVLSCPAIIDVWKITFSWVGAKIWNERPNFLKKIPHKKACKKRPESNVGWQSRKWRCVITTPTKTLKEKHAHTYYLLYSLFIARVTSFFLLIIHICRTVPQICYVLYCTLCNLSNKCSNNNNIMKIV